jgi:hypothetical protein
MISDVSFVRLQICSNESGSDEAYTPEHVENDLDTIAPRCPPLVGASLSSKRKNKESPGKKHVKDKAKCARSTRDDEIAASIAMLAKCIASSCPANTDPYADLWKRIEDLPFPPRDKVDIATYLSKPGQVHLRNYLNAASDQSFGTWVTDYLGAKYRVTGADDGEYGSTM